MLRKGYRIIFSFGVGLATLATVGNPARAQPLSPEPKSSPSLEEATSRKTPRDSLFAAGHGKAGQKTFAIGGVYDALDPRAVAGARFRIPQLTLDARFGMGKGFSLMTHLNTALVVSELGIGANYSFPIAGKLRALAQFQAGLFYGILSGLGFKSSVLAPQFRPLVGLTLPALGIHWSLRGEVVFGVPQLARAGDVRTTLATAKPISNMNLMLMMEQPMKNGRLWYAGLGIMNSTLSYQMWVLFPDSQNNAFYPRLSAGYEF